MKDEYKKREELLEELVELRKRVDKQNASNIRIKKEVTELKAWVNTFDTFVVKCDPNGIMLVCNKGALTAVGTTVEKVFGKCLYDADWWSHSETERAKIVDSIERAKKGVSSRIETSFINTDGTLVPIIFNCQPVIDGGKNVKYITVEGKAIMEETRLRLELEKEIRNHEKAEVALRESEKKYGTLVENSPTGIYIDVDRTISFCNEKFAEIHGYKREELIGTRSLRLVHPEARVLTSEMMVKGLRGERVPTEYEVRGLKKSGENIWITCRNVLIEYEGRSAILGNIVDITKRKFAEERIKSLTQQLIKAQEDERRRIAGDMHDNVAQDLSSARIACEMLFNNLPAVPSEIRRRVSRMSKLLQGSIMAVRDLAYDLLRPLVLDQHGLARAVFQYCQDFSSRNGLNIDFYSAGMDNLRLDFNTEINLYRMIQEGLNNIKKHANARHIAVRLLGSFPKVILRIEDDGKGFDVKDRLQTALNEKRMGLRSMEERVRILNGEMKIRSRPELGTRIFIEVPYKEENNGSKEEHIAG